MLHTIRVNNIEFTIGRKYLHKIVNGGTINEYRTKYALAPEDIATLKDIMSDDNLTSAEQWQKVVAIASYFTED